MVNADSKPVVLFNTLAARALLWLLAGLVLAALVGKIFVAPYFVQTFNKELRKRGDSLTGVLAQHQELRLALALRQRDKADRLAQEFLQGDSDAQYLIFTNADGDLLGGAAVAPNAARTVVSEAQGLKTALARATELAADSEMLRFTLDVMREESQGAGDLPSEDTPQSATKGRKLGTILLGLSPVEARNQLSSLIVVTVMVTALIVVAVSFVFFARLSGRIKRLSAFSAKVASGDLRSHPDERGEDEIGALADSLTEMTVRTGGMVSRLQHAAQSLAKVSNEVLTSATRQGQSAMKQAASVTETGTTVAELREAFNQASERAQQVIDLAKKSDESTTSGRAAVQESVGGMEQIREQVLAISRTMVGLVDRTGQIGSIIDVVNDLAEQSNVLALNAAIEAAKAGEQGRGFAVVAREVRSLAERSKDSTAQIRTILQDIGKAGRDALVVIDEGSRKAHAGSDLARRAGAAIALLDEAINESSTAAKQIAASTRQQAVGVDQIWQAMREIDRSVNESATRVLRSDWGRHRRRRHLRAERSVVPRDQSDG
jgi:methyl-accepting chemotaxis protein